MNNKIYFYNKEGNIDHEDVLNNDTITRINGLKIRVKLKDNSEVVGYSDVFRVLSNYYDGHVHDFINVWTYDNIDESRHILVGEEDEKNKQTIKSILLTDIIYIEALLYSNPSYGSKPTNNFKLYL